MANVANSAFAGSSRTVYQPTGSVLLSNPALPDRIGLPLQSSRLKSYAPSPGVVEIAKAQGVPAAAADVRSVPTSLGAAFTVPEGSLGDAAWQQLQSVLGQLSANSARSTAQSQAFAREQMAFQQAANAKAMEFSAEQAKLDREWQKMMSDTAHQREVEDLRAAGLNPILSAMGGNGAPVGSGATASGVTSSGSRADVYDPNAAMSGVLSSMLSGMMNLEAMNVSARAQEAVADKYTAMQQIVESMRENFEAEYPSNFWRALSTWIEDIANTESGGPGAKSAVGKFAEWLQRKVSK